MFWYFFSLTIILISMFIMSIHPLWMIMVLILVAILNSFLILKIQMLYWISVMIILGVVGGMMILFLYSTSLVPNEKFILNISMINLFMISFLLMLKPFLINIDQSMKSMNINEMYSFHYFIVMFMLILILIMLNFVMKIIFDPLISLKSSY